jgi:hypothetical protein
VTNWTEEAINRISETLNSKGGDYALDEDAFSNFREIADFYGVEAFEAAIGEIVKKLSRLKALKSNGRVPTNESVEDTVRDIAGYGVLALAMLMEYTNDNAVAESIQERVSEFAAITAWKREEAKRKSLMEQYGGPNLFDGTVLSNVQLGEQVLVMRESTPDEEEQKSNDQPRKRPLPEIDFMVGRGFKYEDRSSNEYEDGDVSGWYSNGTYHICASGPHHWGDTGMYWCTRKMNHDKTAENGGHYASNQTMQGVHW